MSSTNAQPLFDRAVILLQDYEASALQWMVVREQQNDGGFELPCVDRLEKESYQECISRELDWRFELNRRRDYIVCSTPRLSLIVNETVTKLVAAEDRASTPFGLLEIYPVQLFGKRSRPVLRSHPQVRFIHCGVVDPYYGEPMESAPSPAPISTGSPSHAEGEPRFNAITLRLFDWMGRRTSSQ